MDQTLDRDCSHNFQSKNQSRFNSLVVDLGLMSLLYLANQPVKIGIARPLDVEVPPADVVDGLIVHHEGAVGVLKGRVSC